MSDFGFGGFKKGFLSSNKKPSSAKGSSSIKSTSSTTATSTSVPAKDVPGVSHKGNGNENSTSNTFSVDTKLRVTENKTLGDLLEDPTWIAILDEFQRDPEGSMNKYKDDVTVRAVMTKLCSTLGDDFLNVSPNAKTKEEAVMKEVMENPYVKAACLSPTVKKILLHSKLNQNDEVRRLISEANEEDRQNIRVLLDFGLLSFSC